MHKSREYIANLLANIKLFKSKYENFKEDVLKLTNNLEYEQVIQHYTKLIKLLENQLSFSPIGYRYKGVFYIKNSYTIPATFDKHEGIVYVREHKLRSQSEHEVKESTTSYFHNIFKVPIDGGELKQEDFKPVYFND